MSKEKRTEGPNPYNPYPSEEKDRLAAEVLILSEHGKTDAEIATLLRIDASDVPRLLTQAKVLPDHIIAASRRRFAESLSAADAAEDTPPSTPETLLREDVETLTYRQHNAVLKARISVLESEIAALESEIAVLRERLKTVENLRAIPKTQPVEKTKPPRDVSHIEADILDYIAEFYPDADIDRVEVIEAFEDEYSKKDLAFAFQKLCSEGRILQITETSPSDGQNRTVFKYNPNFMTKAELQAELKVCFAEYFEKLPTATSVPVSDIRAFVDEHGLVMHSKSMFSKALRQFAKENNIQREPADTDTDTEEMFYK